MGTLTPDRRITLTTWERCSLGTFGDRDPQQLKSHTAPPSEISTEGGPRKPRASNSAGAANNGARVVVSVSLTTDGSDLDSERETATPARRLHSHRPLAGIGRRGHAGPGGNRYKVETRVGAQIDSVPQGMDGGSSRVLYPCLNRHA